MTNEFGPAGRVEAIRTGGIESERGWLLENFASLSLRDVAEALNADILTADDIAEALGKIPSRAEPEDDPDEWI